MTRRWKEARTTPATMLDHSGLTLWITFTAIIVISITTLVASDRDGDDDRDQGGSYAIG